MPWSNQNGGGGGWKGGGGGGPWGQGPGGGGQPPDLEEMLKRSQDRMKKVMRGGGGMHEHAVARMDHGNGFFGGYYFHRQVPGRVRKDGRGGQAVSPANRRQTTPRPSPRL